MQSGDESQGDERSMSREVGESGSCSQLGCACWRTSGGMLLPTGRVQAQLPCSHLRSPFGFMFESDYTILGQKVSLSLRRAKRWKGREEGRIAGLEIIITIS